MDHNIEVRFTSEQYSRLLRESERSGLAIGELVRRAIDHSYPKRDTEVLLGALDESFGAWKDRDFDGESYVEGMRRGMGRRLADGAR